MGKINRANLQAQKEQDSLQLSNLIKRGQWDKVNGELNRICNVIPIFSEIVGSEFVSAVLQEATDEYGTDELVSIGNFYMEDFKPLEITEKDITTACDGVKVKVKVVKCNQPYDSQVGEFAYDYLELSDKKVLSISITQEDLTKRACGLETYNKIRDLILQRAGQTAKRELRDAVFCYINDLRNYKQIVDIPYDCDNCDGDNILSAITRFSSKLQLEAKNYNIAGIDMEVSRKTDMWLIKSTDLESKLSNVLSSKFNSSILNIEDKFAKVFEEPKFTLADGLIMHRQWLQLKQVKQNIYWEFNGKYLVECGNYHYWFKKKAVNFLMAVPFRLVKVSGKDTEASNNLVNKIQDLPDELLATTQPLAEQAIKNKIDKLNTSDRKLKLTYTFDNFKAPTEAGDGSISVIVEVSDQNDKKLTEIKKVFVLTAK